MSLVAYGITGSNALLVEESMDMRKVWQFLLVDEDSIPKVEFDISAFSQSVLEKHYQEHFFFHFPKSRSLISQWMLKHQDGLTVTAAIPRQNFENPRSCLPWCLRC